jgi:hypothetical protein
MPDAGSGRGDNRDVLLGLVAYLLPADPLQEHRRAEAASAGVGEDGNGEIKVEILLSLYVGTVPRSVSNRPFADIRPGSQKSSACNVPEWGDASVSASAKCRRSGVM